MKAIMESESRKRQITHLLSLVEDVDKIIEQDTNNLMHEDSAVRVASRFAVSEYKRHRQDLINQINALMVFYKFQITEMREELIPSV